MVYGVRAKTAKKVAKILGRTTGRRYKRYKKKYSLSIPRPKVSVSGLPNSYPIKMRYCDRIALNLPAFGAIATYQYRLNSIFDPQYSVGGHQPYFRDQFTNIYTNYKVINTKVDIQFVCGTWALIVMRTDDNVVAPANFTLEMERPDSKRVIAIDAYSSKTLKKTYSIPRILKVNKQSYLQDERYIVPYGSDPAPLDTAMLNISAVQTDMTAATAAVLNMVVTLTFDVLLCDLQAQAQS